MSLTEDINATPHLEGALCSGLGALKADDKSHITKNNLTRLTGSVDIDEALKIAQPNAHRWDYMVGVHEGNRIRLHWIEIHPANNSGNIAEIENKLKWLKIWLPSTQLAKYPRSIAWVASGKSTLNSRSPSIKKLANLGLIFKGRHITL